MKLVSGDAGSRDVTSGSIYQDGSVLQTTDIKTLSSTLENGTNMLWMDLKAWREQRSAEQVTNSILANSWRR